MMCGATRAVFLCGRWALKVPRCDEWRLFLSGLLANMSEALWGKVRHGALCPVLAALPGGFLLVMRRARPLTDEEWSDLDVEGLLLDRNYELPVEYKRSSFGVVDGRVVAVDYG